MKGEKDIMEEKQVRTVICGYEPCGEEFETTSRVLKYCSPICAYRAQNAIQVYDRLCEVCHQPFRTARFKVHTCSTPCAYEAEKRRATEVRHKARAGLQTMLDIENKAKLLDYSGKTNLPMLRGNTKPSVIETKHYDVLNTEIVSPSGENIYVSVGNVIDQKIITQLANGNLNNKLNVISIGQLNIEQKQMAVPCGETDELMQDLLSQMPEPKLKNLIDYAISSAISINDGNKTHAAKYLGISLSGIRKKSNRQQLEG